MGDTQKKIVIGHLYPDLLNLYGDRGNIACMMERCRWRGIEAETIEFNTGDEIDFSGLDIVLLGGGSDREQAIVCKNLQKIQKDFKEYVEDGGVVIAVCGGYQLLGNYYKTEDGVIEGLHLVDIYTDKSELVARTSMSRTDTDPTSRGSGACEDMYVKQVQIGNKIYK